MFRCECCQVECPVVFEIENVNSTGTYELLCDSCAELVDQAREDDLFSLTLLDNVLSIASLAA